MRPCCPPCRVRPRLHIPVLLPTRASSPERRWRESHSRWAASARAGKGKPVVRVLEARFEPPYEGATGLGYRNVPGMPRLASAAFTGEFPLARIDFEDAELPVRVRLDAFTPFIPLDADASGLPAAVLRYRVRNPGRVKAAVSIAFSIDNPVGEAGRTAQ